MVGGPAYEWVPKDGSAVGGLAMAVGGCGMQWVSGWQWLCVCVCVFL